MNRALPEELRDAVEELDPYNPALNNLVALALEAADALEDMHKFMDNLKDLMA